MLWSQKSFAVCSHTWGSFTNRKNKAALFFLHTAITSLFCFSKSTKRTVHGTTGGCLGKGPWFISSDCHVRCTWIPTWSWHRLLGQRDLPAGQQSLVTLLLREADGAHLGCSSISSIFSVVLCCKPCFSLRICCFKATAAWVKMWSYPVAEKFPIYLLSLVTLLEVVQNLKKDVKKGLLCSFLAVLASLWRFHILRASLTMRLWLEKFPYLVPLQGAVTLTYIRNKKWSYKLLYQEGL